MDKNYDTIKEENRERVYRLLSAGVHKKIIANSYSLPDEIVAELAIEYYSMKHDDFVKEYLKNHKMEIMGRFSSTKPNFIEIDVKAETERGILLLYGHLKGK